MTDRTATVDVQIPSPQELAQKYGPYLSNPKLERPTEETPQFRHIRDDQRRREAVADAQRQWDTAKAERERIAAWSAGLRAEREAKAAAERNARDDARQAERQQARDELEARLKREFLTRPGTLESDWTEERKQKELDAHFDRQRDAAQAQAAIYRGTF